MNLLRTHFWAERLIFKTIATENFDGINPTSHPLRGIAMSGRQDL